MLCCVDDQLPPQLCFRWKLLLHRESCGSTAASTHRPHCIIAQRLSGNAATSPIHDRRHRRLTRPFARWRQIKAAYSRNLPGGVPVSRSRTEKRERGIWQRRYWEHTIRDEPDFARHADYIHFNPVKHGHVRRVCDWPYSSFLGLVRLGVYPLDWAADQ